ncbi:hypothetical protein Tco_1335135 [Tanacetum coccineum]
MPSFTIKWLFSQFRDKLVSSHRFNIFSKWVRHVEKESPKTEKSSMNTSIVFSIISWKIAIIHQWNEPRLSFLDLLGQLESGNNPRSHRGNSSIRFLPVFRAFGP